MLLHMATLFKRLSAVFAGKRLRLRMNSTLVEGQRRRKDEAFSTLRADVGRVLGVAEHVLAKRGSRREREITLTTSVGSFPGVQSLVHRQ